MLGVCYYPEHWPEAWWSEDARRMRSLGLTYVRIGEFAWSRLEPEPGELRFEWLDRAVAVLADAGLKVVLGTPTATPPKWLVDRHPEILPVHPDTGRTRGFGSRRHYDFSSEVYLAEALRISEAMARRYGEHPGVVGWQTDNELGCHDTTLSASVAARDGFRRWCRERYGDVQSLNTAWGNVFWSMEYRSFDEIELPVGAVTETSPSHRLAWRRYASDQVVRFHDAMTAVIRRFSPGRFVTHNFIPMHETGVDNHALAAPLDFASYDNYPLGRTDLAMADAPAEAFRPYMRTGHPDLGAVLFDQTRGLAPGRFWVMEQQPGPVNWARHNPRPAPGMIRLWTLEAFAHEAGCVSYFRWRQAPFGQEQMHAGLLRSDSTPSEAWPEVEQVARDLQALQLDQGPAGRADAALVVDVEAQWLSDIERQGQGYDYTRVLHAWYGALRALGLNVDFVSPDNDLSGYRLLLAPALAMPDPERVQRLAASGALIVFGPRSGGKTAELTTPEGLAPGPLRALLPIRVLSVETLRPDCPGGLNYGGVSYASGIWREWLDPGEAQVLGTYEDGAPALVRAGRAIYLAALTDDAFLRKLFVDLCAEAGVATNPVPADVRLRRRGDLTFAFNYGEAAVEVPAPADAVFVLGGRTLPGRNVSVWRT